MRRKSLKQTKTKKTVASRTTNNAQNDVFQSEHDIHAPKDNIIQNGQRVSWADRQDADLDSFDSTTRSLETDQVTEKQFQKRILEPPVSSIETKDKKSVLLMSQPSNASDFSDESDRDMIEMEFGEPPPGLLFMQLLKAGEIISKVNTSTLAALAVSKEEWNILRELLVELGLTFQDKVRFSWDESNEA